MTETGRKVESLGSRMRASRLEALRLRGVDWFSWITGGGSSVVILTREVGCAEALITLDRAFILTNEIEEKRLREAEAMTDCLLEAKPDWTEEELAGVGARAMWQRGIHPTLTLVAGEERLGIYRHPTPTSKRLGSKAMLVFCGRRHGLYACLTRFVYFKAPSGEEKKHHEDVSRVEMVALDASRPGAPLSEIFHGIAGAYRDLGYPGEEKKHHQGGTTGYLSREVIATPSTTDALDLNVAVAWNPSLPGAKIEDTVVITSEGPEVLTSDPRWPMRKVGSRMRPDLLVRA